MEPQDFFGDWKEEVLGLLTTVGRYALTVEPMARKIRADESILRDALITVGLDIADGKITRFISRAVLGTNGDDTPLRRIADGVLDHATVARVGWEVGKKNPSSRPYLGLLAARAAFAAAGLNGYHLATTGEVTKGRKWQKATHLTTALFGVAAATNNKSLTHITGIVASSVAWATAPAHFKELGIRRNRRFREL